MKLILGLLLFPVMASAATSDWTVESGTLRYTLKHMLHTVEGTSKEVKGLGRCDKDCQFLVAAPVKSFNSENANRDSNMQQITHAAVNPMTELRATVKAPAAGTVKTQGEVKFAGKSHSYPLELTFSPEKNGFRVRTKIPLKLSDFEVERPSLFGVAVENDVPVDVDLVIVPRNK